MHKHTFLKLKAATSTAVASVAAAAAPDALEKAFEALTTYDRGSSRGALMPIDNAVRASLDNATARQELEKRLVALLQAKGSYVAKEYLCAKLALIGSTQAVPALAARLAEADFANLARSALESLPVPEASAALRDNLPNFSGQQKVGIINSLGARRDPGALSKLAALLDDSDAAVVASAAAALGKLGTPPAAQALLKFQPKAPQAIGLKVTDACLACAERLQVNGFKAEARALYKALDGPHQPKHVQLACQRGLG